MRPPFRRRLALAVSASAGMFACDVQPNAPVARPPVVGLLLFADESVHVATITRASPADSALPDAPTRIDPALVDLRVVDESGSAHSLTFDSTTGRFTVAVRARRGARLRLAGTVDGVTVSGETTIPQTFAIDAPAADTITEAHGQACGTFIFPEWCVPYQFRSEATAFEYRILSAAGATLFLQPLHSATGELVAPLDSAVRSAVFIAYNSDAAGWLQHETPQSNLRGSVGYLGGALRLRRWLYLP